MMNTTEILVTMNNTMFMQVDGGFVIGSLISPVKYLIDKIKIGFINTVGIECVVLLYRKIIMV